MRAWQLDDSTGSPKLRLADMPQPTAGPGELLIRVHASGVTPTELGWYPTTHQKSGEKRLLAVPGHEFSGTIAAIGQGVSTFALGQEIFGMNDWFADGATADFCISRPEWLAAKPQKLTHAQAAAVPIGALTAWQGLFDRAHLQPNERVLIHGGSGAVGVFAIQFARRRGAHVITTASERNLEFLLQLGAQQVIDYHTEKFEEAAKNIDVIFDAVGGDTLARSWALLGPKGRLVTIASDASASSDERVKKAFFIVEPNAGQLAHIAAQLDAGSLQVVVDATVPIERADAAYLGQVQPRQGRGKTVITLIP